MTHKGVTDKAATYKGHSLPLFLDSNGDLRLISLKLQLKY